MMTTATKEAIGYFGQAIELDPKFALAYVGLTKSYLEQFQNSDSPLDEMLARAQAAADKALELDDRRAETHVALGQVKWWRNDFEGAEAAFQRALALNPNSVMAYDTYGNLLIADLARYEEGLVLHRKAVELDPLSLESITNLIGALFSMGRHDEGLALCERVLEIDPGYAWGHQLIGIYHLFSGRLDEAVLWWAKGVALDPESPFALAILGELFLELGDPARAEYWINRSVELGPGNIYTHLAMQGLGVYRGDEAAALQHGRKAFAIWPLEFNVLTHLRDQEVRAGRYVEARALYEEWFPELLVEPDPHVEERNHQAAVDLALILSRTGQPERASLLLNRSLQQIQSGSLSRGGRHGYGFAEVQIYALQGEMQKALSALRAAIDEGWRADWWWWLRKPDLEPLRGEPEFQAMVEEIEADMAAQLARVREMERNGELPMIPPIGTSPAN
jgi:tetratricopeptide (TPR) repeat protein